MAHWALFLHLVGAILFFAGLAVAAVGQLSARGRSDPREIAALLGTARWGVALVGSGGLLAVACGFWLLAETRFGLDGWVLGALALLAAAFAAGGVGGQAPKRARRLAGELARDGAVTLTPELRALLRDRRADALNVVAAAASVAVLALMVWKPGA